MKDILIGIVDYGTGNLASIKNTLYYLGYRSIISNDKEVLDEVDLILLPGVGAFPHAMETIRSLKLDFFIQAKAKNNIPIIGICLGMQLFADISYEGRPTKGLGLISGEVKPISNSSWHIGWNKMQLYKKDNLFSSSDLRSMYFNHSYYFDVDEKYKIAKSILNSDGLAIPSVIMKNNIIGFQFHPEKSQDAGKELFINTIEGIDYAQ